MSTTNLNLDTVASDSHLNAFPAVFNANMQKIDAAVGDLSSQQQGGSAPANAYVKPAGGIPLSDLASAVQTSLGKADSALQSVPNTYRAAADQDNIDSGKASAADVSAMKTALSAVLTQLSQLIPKLAFTDAFHNGAATVSAISAAISAMSGSGTQTAYTVTKALSNCAISNAAVSVTQGSSYSATLTANSGYTLGTVTVTMGGTDITSSAYNSATGAVSIASVTGNIVITASATAAQPTYTANAVYTNFTATGARFSTDSLSVNFANGDYVEAKIDATACTTDATNIFTVAKSGSNDYLDYSTGEGVLIYKRLQSGVDKILFRVKDTANSVAIDKWVVPADMSDLTIKLDKDGVYLDGTKVSGISASDLAFLTGQSAIAVGARASKLSYATYESVTVYRAN